MNYFYEIATVLFTCLLVHIFFNGWFGVKNLGRSRMVLFMASYFFLHSIATLLPLSPLILIAVSFLLFFGIAGALYQTTLTSALYSSLLFVALAVLSQYLCLVLLNALGVDTSILMAGGNARAILLVLAKTVHFAVVLIVASVLRKNRVALSIKQVVPLLPCLIVSIYICYDHKI